MDQQKDINRTDKDVRPLDRYQYGPYSDYGGVVVVHRKTERVVAALFLVTEYLSGDNPIRHRIRYVGVELMSFILSNQDKELDSDGSYFIRTYASHLLEVASLLEVAFLSEQISEMNFRLLGSEIERLVSIAEKVKRQTGSISDTSKIGSVFLHDNLSDRGSGGVSVSSKLRQRVFGKGHIKRTKNIKGGVGASVNGSRDTQKELASSDSTKKNRKDIILKALSSGNLMSVKDFSSVLDGVSEKTIQRELVALVSSGVLKREGARRWSKYYLSNTSQPAVS